MFGKSGSTNDFVMMMGRKAGNIKRAKAAPAGAGKKAVATAGRPASKSIPAAPAGTGKKPKPQIKVMVPKPQMHSGNGMTGALSMTSKRGLGVNQNIPQSPGKSNTFKTSRD